MNIQNNNNYLITVTGPTAIGKTAMAIEIAKYYNCPIISADSRQFFKEMNIGTAVPSKEEQEAAKHYFIQNISIFDDYTVGDFEREAITVLDELFKKNNVVVMVGGSGLYIDAVLKGFDDFPDIDNSVREQLKEKYETLGITYLQEELERLDPEHYSNVAKENPQRLMRALEVCSGSGKPYSSFLNIKKNSRNFTSIIIGLEAEREVMYSRINQRVDLMVQAGLIEEAKALYPHKNLNALQTVGYRELFSYFDDEYSLDFAIEEIKKNTRRFAKRQMTWFKRKEETKWFNFTTSPHIVINYIKENL
ncbi:tRNA (adenosine(37)-N6)-dimethylallyltransferase MiaA [Flavobacterium arcticum]|uniref:tRNA dimethylallyltransferase n=1 Tax=Flavobacterium arcticum TaxID=1784713 RepID=A0A345HCN0_9FLAO|nr:tRNA (adenosine(37)-N6)-dimethylallyltransferase MiaA [Flavobacterium arcticum]AXG74340.1 tRNA (adenosine(37)-N6)-dimethylallyltransferase MiaA [Flavobacterium arcticum]KAF2507546.1 tRNA (adenosine(37)-N6)-dimethylallyltransferase MiaA [Flavobacterium arcticum]